VTEELAERLPRGHVVALDASAEMIAAARARLARFGDRIEYVTADLGRPLPIDEPVDGVLSTATFHCVPDHDTLFRNLAAVMRPDGRLSVQFGGEGNVESVMRILRSMGDGWPGPAHFETVLATVRRLDAAGFVDVEAWLEPQPTAFEPGEPFAAFLRTVVLGPHVDRLPEAEREPFVAEVVRRLGRPVLDYVRLNVVARRG
jgi:trans-aconitate 2-methyltransferase